MNGPRDLSDVWAAVFAAAYVAEHQRKQWPGDDAAHDHLARVAAATADEAVKALHRVRGSEGT